MKKFLLLGEFSFLGIILFTFLHNIVSGLVHADEPIFFLLAAVICPIGMVIGIIGSIVLALVEKAP